MIQWMLVPSNAAFLNLIAFGIGTVGLLLTLLALAIALKQLKAIKTETEASKAAIDAVQLKVASFDTAQECATAKSLINSIRADLKAGQLGEVIQKYESLIESFLRLAHSPSVIADPDRALMLKHTSHMAKICEGLRKKVALGAGAAPPRGQDQALRDFTDIMTKVNFAVVQELQR
jgi:hypothetical protein